MLQIETYIKKEGIITSLNNINKNYLNYFCLFDSERCLKYIKDYNYIEGCIIIIYYGEYILDFKYWDIVEDLWCYIIDAIDEIMNGKQITKFLFPDQPVEVQIQCVSKDQILIKIGKTTHVICKSEFIDEILNGAEKFFSILALCNNSVTVLNCKNRLKKIKELQKMHIT